MQAMHFQAISIHEHDLSLSCSIGIEAVSPWVSFTLRAHEGGFFSSKYEKSFLAEQKSFLRALERLENRIEGGGARRSLEHWPHRPTRGMRKDCYFLGSLRGMNQRYTLRGQAYTETVRWRFALVPGRNGTPVLELSLDKDVESSGFQVPSRMIKALRHALVRIISGKELTPEENLRAPTLFDAALSEFLDNGSVTQTRCNQCGGPIQVESTGQARYHFRCPCGKFQHQDEAPRLRKG